MSPHHVFRFALFGALSLAAACSQAPTTSSSLTPAQSADAIYTGGDIVTVNDAQPTVEAVAVKDGRILAVGTRADVERAHKATTTVVVDLAGKTLIPAFLDPHSHYFSSLTVANQVNVYPAPAGPGTDPASIVAALVKFRDERRIPAGEVIQAYGYDDSAMPAGNLLNRDHLDTALPDNPVIVQHVSMHGAVLNSAALKKWKVSAATRTPPGGIIVRKPGTQEPFGLIMETAWLPIFGSLPKPTAEQEIRLDEGRAAALRELRHQHGARRRDACRRPRRDDAGRAGRRQPDRRHRVSVHHRRRCRPRGAPRVHLGHLQPAPEDRRGEDHD